MEVPIKLPPMKPPWTRLERPNTTNTIAALVTT